MRWKPRTWKRDSLSPFSLASAVLLHWVLTLPGSSQPPPQENWALSFLFCLLGTRLGFDCSFKVMTLVSPDPRMTCCPIHLTKGLAAGPRPTFLGLPTHVPPSGGVQAFSQPGQAVPLPLPAPSPPQQPACPSEPVPVNQESPGMLPGSLPPSPPPGMVTFRDMGCGCLSLRQVTFGECGTPLFSSSK